jgi:hypothetical protein
MPNNGKLFFFFAFSPFPGFSSPYLTCSGYLPLAWQEQEYFLPLPLQLEIGVA